MATHRLSVSGMACTGCESNVEEALAAVSGVTTVTADHERGIVDLEADESVSEDAVAAAIEDAGYAVSA